eukprot:8264051-Ditylum_brightwellii.AAC.1
MEGSFALFAQEVCWTAQRCTHIHGGGCSLQAARANIKSDADPKSGTRKRRHFESTATYLLPFCLVIRKNPSDTKHNTIKILDRLWDQVKYWDFRIEPEISRNKGV